MSLEQTVDNLEIRYANVVTFVGTSNTMIDTTTGRIQTKGIQHNSNVITDVSGPHGRVAPTLKKYPEIAFEEGKFDRNDTTNTYTQAGYTVTASSQYNASYAVHHTFNDVLQDIEAGAGGILWTSATSTYPAAGGDYIGTTHGIGTAYGEFIKLELPYKIKPKEVRIFPRTFQGGGAGNSQSPAQFKIFGSNDNFSSEIVELYHQNTDWVNNETWGVFDISHTTHFKHFGIVFTKTNGTNIVGVQEIEYYGYEEYTPAGDHSVDTTFMSRFNNPQLTGVQVLVDGATGQGTNQISGGPDPSGNQSTMTSPNKYWTLNGTLTSNLSVEANTFLEGDQPHAVSVWFNSSNLEANVSNTCVFSVSDQEHLNSENLDLQSNTWHNLTYAYQGEGGSRVTYLDGRKVAEDQAEDTFGEYPPFAMTGLSQGGYVLSTNGSITPGSTNALPHYAFDNRINNFFGFGLIATPGTGTNQTGGPTMPGTVDGSTLPSGYWLKLELPHKLHVNSYNITPRGDVSQPDSSPLTWKVYGSNDDSVWTLLHEKTDSTPINPRVSTTDNPGSTFAVSTIGSFRYIALIVLTNAGYAYLNLGELKYYGHRENDLVRLPDPTNVLKYPHIAMTGPAQRGYVASASSEHSGSTFDGYNGIQEGKLFDDDPATFWHTETNGTDDHRYDGTADAAGGRPYGAGSISNFDPTGINIPGEWVQLEFPHKLKISKVHIRARSNQEVQAPKDFAFYGSDTGSAGSWTLIQSFTGEAPQDDGTSYYAITSNPAHYKYILMLITRTVGTTAMSMAALQYFGTGVDSIPIQIGGGNIDKVANFRVYDKFIGEDQALEIWDAQKDEFGRAKSSMTLQKGRLGIGTDEPQGRLAVADEPHNLEEFPPRAMTGYKTHFEGHGEFCVSASDEHSSNYDVQNAFNKITNRLNSSGGTTNTYYNGGEPTPRYYDVGNDYAYSGTSSTHGLGGVMGEWVKLEFPYKANISQISILPVDVQISTLAPEDFTIMGSSDDINWTTLRTVTGATWTAHNFNEYTLPSTTSYKYFALVVSRTVGSNQLSIQELKYFGTREQGQSVLHDGQLTLTKSLTVPRIGPALDADDTPRRDRLVVEYNTSTNPTFEGAVRDTSGRGNDGVFVGEVSYDATEKALVFPGTIGNYLRTGALNTFVGNQAFTFSGWFRRTNTSTARQDWFYLGKPGTAYGSAFSIFTSGNSTYAYGFGNDIYSTTNQIPDQSWYHVMITFVGGIPNTTNKKVYLNGADITSAFTSSATQTQNFQPDSPLVLGIGADLSYPAPVNISNFKLYDCALTAEEVKTLYDMGRCDEGHHVVNFSKTRVGIGLGDGEAPRAALDVRGVANFSELEVRGDVRLRGSQSYPNRPVAVVGLNSGRVYAPNVMVYNQVLYNDGNLYNTSNGRFTAPEGYAGYYLITYTGLSGEKELGPNTRWQLNGNNLDWGAAHINLGTGVNMNTTNARLGMNNQLIYYLNEGDYLTHKVHTGSIYGSATVHSTTVVMFMGSR